MSVPEVFAEELAMRTSVTLERVSGGGNVGGSGKETVAIKFDATKADVAECRGG